MYNHKRIQQSRAAADIFINNLLWITSIFHVILSVAGIIFAPFLVRIFAPDFDVQSVAITIHIMRLTFIFTLAVHISNFMISISQINNKFAVTIISTFPFNFFTIIAIIFFADELGIYALVIGYILFLLTQVFILVLAVRKIFNFKAILNFTNGDLKSVYKLSFPLYISVAIWEINMIVDKILASGLPEGSISAMIYAARLRALPDGIITASILTVIFPLFSEYAAKKDFDKLKMLTTKSISVLFMILLPVILISVYYAHEITKIVYERGIFTEDKTALTANIFVFTVISLVFSGGAALLSNLFYSIQDTKTPQISASIMVICNLLLNLILIRYMQAAGLALATSVASLIYFLMLSIQFRFKFGVCNGTALFKDISKCAVATAGMLPVFLLCGLFSDKLPLSLFFILTVVFSLAIYSCLIYFLRVKIYMEILVQLRSTFLHSGRKITIPNINFLTILNTRKK
jgi:putative peptidoglycan lipid II flippase